MSEELFDRPSDLGNTDKPKEKESKPPKKKRAKPSKSDVFTVDDCTGKIFQLYKLYNKLLATEPTFKEKDFTEEGAALSRLTEKYTMVSVGMKMLDPLFFALGTFNKFSGHFSEFNARKKRERAARKAQEQGQGMISIEQPDQAS